MLFYQLVTKEEFLIITTLMFPVISDDVTANEHAEESLESLVFLLHWLRLKLIRMRMMMMMMMIRVTEFLVG